MAETLAQLELPPPFPDHTQLPESDGTFVKNFQEHPQSLILTDSITPILQQLHPDGQYAIGQDCGIYWREVDPPEQGAEAPDWFYVPNVPPQMGEQIRRSYVLWREFITPTIVLEFASGDGSEERDQTPLVRSGGEGTPRPGKFWVYEQIMRIPYYGIYLVNNGTLAMYRLEGSVYQPMTPNQRGHYEIQPMQVELGLWRGEVLNYPDQPWLRWWDLAGNLLLTGTELAELERYRTEQAEQRAEQERQRAEQERQRAEQAEQRVEEEQQKRDQLVDRLKALSPDQLSALGIDPGLLG